MQRASEPIRRLSFLVVLLALAPAVAALPSASPARYATARRRRAPSPADRVRSRSTARRRRSRILATPAYVLTSARIPSRHFNTVKAEAPSSAFSPGPYPMQDDPLQGDRRLPRQAPPKTAALQGIVQDRSGRGIPGALIAITHRATGFTQTISTNADGVFRWTDLAPGIYLLLAQSDGFENLARDDLQVIAGDAVTLELTLFPSVISA